MPGPVVNGGRAIAARPRAAHVRPLQRGWIIYACHALTCSFHPIGPFVNALARPGADRDDPCVRVAQGHILAAFVHVKVKIRQHVDLVDKNDVATWNISGYFSGLS